jgi:hypothetical protein
MPFFFFFFLRKRDETKCHDWEKQNAKVDGRNDDMINGERLNPLAVQSSVFYVRSCLSVSTDAQPDEERERRRRRIGKEMHAHILPLCTQHSHT